MKAVKQRLEALEEQRGPFTPPAPVLVFEVEEDGNKQLAFTAYVG